MEQEEKSGISLGHSIETKTSGDPRRMTEADALAEWERELLEEIKQLEEEMKVDGEEMEKLGEERGDLMNLFVSPGANTEKIRKAIVEKDRRIKELDDAYNKKRSIIREKRSHIHRQRNKKPR